MPVRINTLLTLFASFLLLTAIISVPETYAAATKEDKVKAAILYKITKFITWPSKKRNLTICILGEGPINTELSRIQHKSSMGRRISVTHKDINAPFAKLCDILFIHNIKNEAVAPILKELKGKPVLTVSDGKQFAEQGGVVGLSRKGSRINFAINSNSADAAGLTISSQLLGMAKVIQ